jgi:hypothetical protein
MATRPAILLGTACLLTLGTAACGGSPAASSTSVKASPPATATPLPPDSQSVAVAKTGYGTLDLATIPVAVLVNQASRHSAEAVTVHFTALSARGAPIHALTSVAVNLPPSATLVVTADCTDACVGTASVSATVSVGSWVDRSGVLVTASPASFQCPRCSPSHADGEVSTTLSSSPVLGAGAAVATFAACMDGAGVIVGGGFAHLLWPGGASTPMSISAIVNRPPATCTVSATTGW